MTNEHVGAQPQYRGRQKFIMTPISNNLLENTIKIALVVLLAIIVTHFIAVELSMVANKITEAVGRVGY